MCGISAVLETGKRKPFDGSALARMHNLLRHRGPDGQGFLRVREDLTASYSSCLESVHEAETRFGAAFHWLKILDLSSASMQPFCSVDRLRWLLFNGEIYNFRELRRALGTHGHDFRTAGDAEVALAAYAQWGTGCFQRFHGMWAMLIVDLQQGILVGCRDRLGIKPLFYSWDDTRFLLASEPKAVALARNDGPEINAEHFHRFLHGLPPDSSSDTFFRNVHAVPAGTYFTLPLRAEGAVNLDFRAFWNLSDFCVDDKPLPFEEARESFESLVEQSLKEHFSAGVPVGALLSGGLDSSLLVSMAAQRLCANGTPRPKTFSVIYKDPEMSEWPYIQLVLAKHRLEGKNVLMTPELAWQSIATVVRVQGQPLLGQDMIAQYHAYRLAREHGTTVVLDGQGADEILGGLPNYESEFLLSLVWGLQLSRVIRELRARSRKYENGMLATLRAYLANPVRRRIRQSMGRPKYDWLEPARDFEQAAEDRPFRDIDRSRDSSGLNRFLYQLVKHTNLPTVLQQQDRSSMAHGVESRVPFLDHRIVEFSFRLPDDYKIRLGDRKKILLETARKYLPSPVVNRRDKRMFVSGQRWMELRQHADELRATVHNRTLQESPLFSAQKSARFVEDFLRGKHDDAKAVWRIHTAGQWLEAFRPH